KHMQEKGFNLERGEKGSDREHMETRKFKKHMLEKDIDSLEKELAFKRNEVKSYVEKSDDVKLDIKAKKQYKNVEVPTGEKTMFSKEKTERKQKEAGNVINYRKNYEEMINDAKDNEHLQKQVVEFTNTDMYKAYDRERKENKIVK